MADAYTDVVMYVMCGVITIVYVIVADDWIAVYETLVIPIIT